MPVLIILITFEDFPLKRVVHFQTSGPLFKPVVHFLIKCCKLVVISTYSKRVVHFLDTSLKRVVHFWAFFFPSLYNIVYYITLSKKISKSGPLV